MLRRVIKDMIYIIYVYVCIYVWIHRVSYQIYKAKLKNELTPNRKKTQLF